MTIAEIGPPRVLIIKQAESRYLYTRTHGSLSEILEENLGCSGPLALITRLHADIAIVSDAHTLECRAWKEGIRMGMDAKRRIAEAYEAAREPSLAAECCLLGDIPWDSYDIVISVYVSVPRSVIAKHPGILWCYYVVDPCPSFLVSKHFFPMFGYNVFLNQNLSPGAPGKDTLSRFRRYRKASINFPYTAIDRDTISRTYPVQCQEGVLVDIRSYGRSTPQQLRALSRFGTVSGGRVPVGEFMRQLAGRKYFVALDPGPIHFRGNPLVEASSAGCLILVPRGMNVMYKQLILPECLHDGFDDLVEKLTALEADPERYHGALDRQRDLVTQYACTNPLDELMSLYRILRSDDFVRGSRIRADVVDMAMYVIFASLFFVLVPLYSFMNRMVEKLTGRALTAWIPRTVNRKGKLF